MRIGILGLLHESNTFVPTATRLADFHREVIARGDQVRAYFGQAPHEIGGFFEGVEAAGHEAVGVFAASAYPAGTITSDTLDELLAMMDDAWREAASAGRFDGLLVAAHGAAVCEAAADMDGHWLSRLRERVGPDMPIVCTLDPHANLTPAMVSAVDATITYRTNPHLDQRERGLEAASLLARHLAGQVRLTQACALPPVAINIERQQTDGPACVPLVEQAQAMRARPGVLSVSVVLGFPYADVAEMGSGFVVVTDDDPSLAQACADELAAWLIQHRERFRAELIEPDEALERVAQAEQPVCLLDMGDNVGGGSAGDGTFIAHAVLRRGGPATFIAINDPQASQAAAKAGVDAVIRLEMGGKVDQQHGPPLSCEVRVISLHDGRFTETQVRHGGKTQYDMGPTAVVRTLDGALTVQLTSHRTTPFSLGQLTSCDVNPADYAALVAKGVNAPVAAYAPVCPTILRVNTAGSTTADMAKLSYRHRRRPLWPFEPIV